MKKKNGGYTISGPGVDQGGYESGGIGLSAAITHAKPIPEGTAVYVRDADGEIFGRVEHVEGGDFHVYRMVEV